MISRIIIAILFILTTTAYAAPVPDTGQTKCYNDTSEIPCPTAGQDFYGQDANYSINPMSYTKLDATGNDLPITATDWAMVRDNVTGLIWENKTDDGSIHDKDNTYTWDNASSVFIAKLNADNFGGHSDWRLPFLEELGSIVDFSMPYPVPTIFTDVFKDTIASFYWSSSTSANNISNAWGVYFTNGYDYYKFNKIGANYVRAVRAGQSVIRSFDNLVINGDSTVTDPTTGLMWQQDTAKTPISSTMVWKDALSYCENLNLGGYTDWRLPTVKELRTIVDISIPSPGPTIFTDVFKDTIASFYWSSSTNGKSSAWVVNFDNGSDGSSGKNDASYVRAVRAGQSVTGSFDKTNIALGKTVTASTNSEVGTPSAIVDGNSDTLWYSYQGNPTVQDFVLDLGDVYTIDKVDMNVLQVYGVSVSTSTDGITYTERFKRDGQSYVGLLSFTGDGTYQVRYIKYHAYADWAQYVGLSEIEVWGETPVIGPLDNLVVSVNISPVSATLTQPNDEIRFLVKGYLSNGQITTPENILWQTSDSNVVKIDGDKVVSVGEGTAVITASVGDLTAQAQVTVAFAPVSIDVSPVLIFLESGKSASPVVSAIYPDGRRKDLTEPSDYSLTVVKGTDVSIPDYVKIDGHTITALSSGVSGMSDIEVKAKFGTEQKELSAMIRVNVTAPVPLNITPASVRVKQSESVLVEIDGGTPPYLPIDGNGTVEQRQGKYIFTITAPLEGGEHTYTLKDTTGQNATLRVTVLAPLEIKSGDMSSLSKSSYTNPSTVGFAAQKSDIKQVSLRANGGTPPFKWYSTAGEILPNSTSDTSQISYTPPSIAGVYTVTVVDSGGQSQDFKVSTNLQLKTTPEQIYLSPNESRDISILGGLAPFKVVADAGNVSQLQLKSGLSTFSYTAPSTSGDYMLSVKDAEGNVVRVYATVSLPLTVSPSIVYMRRNETRTFKLAGGIGKDKDIVIAASKGDGDILNGDKLSTHPENMSFSYKSSDVTGSNILTVTDMSGNQVVVNIEVTSDNFFITPLTATLLKDEKRVFKTVGGTTKTSGETGGVIWQVKQGDGDIIGVPDQNKPSIEYTAPNMRVRSVISAIDMEEREATANIHVISDKVLISPSQVFLKPGESAKFRGLFGTEEYTFTWTNGDGKTDETSGIFTYTAPSKTGIHYITVFDSAGNSAKAEAIVSGGLKREKIEKAKAFEIKTPSAQPNSETQPAAVGNMQNGGDNFALAFDFPNYEDKVGNSVPMNFYVGAWIPEWNFFGLFDAQGGVVDLNTRIVPCMSKMTDAVYTESLKFNYCNPGAPVKVDMYILAVESGYDLNSNLTFEPADAPFELWHYNFSFPECP